LIVDAVFAIDFVHAMVYGAATIVLLQLGTIAIYAPSIALVMREKRDLRRLRMDIDVALERVLPSRHLPRDQHKALASAKVFLETVQAISRAETPGPEAELAAAAEDLLVRIEIDEAELGPDHPIVASGLDRLQVMFALMGYSSETERLIRRASPIAQRVSRSNPKLRIDLAPLVREQNELR
jgi:hypothetical protein